MAWEFFYRDLCPPPSPTCIGWVPHNLDAAPMAGHCAAHARCLPRCCSVVFNFHRSPIKLTAAHLTTPLDLREAHVGGARPHHVAISRAFHAAAARMCCNHCRLHPQQRSPPPWALPRAPAAISFSFEHQVQS
uniref:Uncharacterized protein n=1 Tax=Arundo donax TaxID=35708 RepID=A0A0A9HKS1_ARUDO